MAQPVSDSLSPQTTPNTIATTSFPSQASSSSYPQAQNGHSSYPGLPPPPPSERIPPSKGRSTHHPSHQKLKLMRKGRDKERARHQAKEDEEWTLEGSTSNGHREKALPVPPVELDAELLYDSQLTEVPPPKDEKEGRKAKGRGVVKKTSRLFFSRIGKDRPGEGEPSSAVTSDSTSSLQMPSGSRQVSYSSVTSSEISGSSRNHFSALNRPFSHTSSNKSPRSSHSRRPSQESQGSWQAAARSIRSGSTSTHSSPVEGHQLVIPQRQSSHQGASAPTLSRQALPQPAENANGSGAINSARNGDTFPTRMSTWFSHLLPSASSSTVAEPSAPAAQVDSPQQYPSSPARKPPSAAAFFLNAARQRAVDGVRHLLDSEAQLDKCPDTMWVLGVSHPGWRPSSPSRCSPGQQFADLPESDGNGRRRSSSSEKPSPPPKNEAGSLRPAAWGKRKDPSAPISPPSKGFSNLFSSSSLSLALPASMASGSPSKDASGSGAVADSPGRAKNRKAEKEVVRWPDECAPKLLSNRMRLILTQSTTTFAHESGVPTAHNTLRSSQCLAERSYPAVMPTTPLSDHLQIPPAANHSQDFRQLLLCQIESLLQRGAGLGRARREDSRAMRVGDVC